MTASTDLLHIGTQLSNVAFNFAQRPGYVLTDHDCAMLNDLRKQWDTAPRPTLPPSGISGGLAAPVEGRATDAQIQEWADRHDLGDSLHTLRAMFEDAQTLVQPTAALASKADARMHAREVAEDGPPPTHPLTDFQAAWLLAIDALHEIDVLLGNDQGGCDDPEVTVSALKDYLATAAEWQQQRNDLLDQNFLLAAPVQVEPSDEEIMAAWTNTEPQGDPSGKRFALAFGRAVLALGGSVAQEHPDAKRLDWLEETASEAHISMCFEFDGGVHVTVEPPSVPARAYRHKDTIRDAIDTAISRSAGAAQEGQDESR